MTSCSVNNLVELAEGEEGSWLGNRLSIRSGPKSRQSQLEYSSQFLAPQYKGDVHTRPSPVKGHEDDKGLEHLSYKERLRELGQFSLEKRRLRGISYQFV